MATAKQAIRAGEPSSTATGSMASIPGAQMRNVNFRASSTGRPRRMK